MTFAAVLTMDDVRQSSLNLLGGRGFLFIRFRLHVLGAYLNAMLPLPVLGRDLKIIARPLWSSAREILSTPSDFSSFNVSTAHITLASGRTPFTSLQFSFLPLLMYPA